VGGRQPHGRGQAHLGHVEVPQGHPGPGRVRAQAGPRGFGYRRRRRARHQEADQVRKLEAMEDMHVIESPQKMKEFLLEWLKTLKN